MAELAELPVVVVAVMVSETAPVLVVPVAQAETAWSSCTPGKITQLKKKRPKGRFFLYATCR